MGRSRRKPDAEAEKDRAKLRQRRLLLGVAFPIFAAVCVSAAFFLGRLERRGTDGAASETAAVSDREDGLNGDGLDENGLNEDGLNEDGGFLTIEPDTKEYTYDFGTSILTRDGIPEIYQLMERHYQAIEDCDGEAFCRLFTSQDMSQAEAYSREFAQQKTYVDGYENLSCYTVPGLSDGEYAVYVYYEKRYTGVETAAPGLVQVYAVRSEEGSFLIDDGEADPERTAFLEELSRQEDVLLLIRDVDQRLLQAEASDPALQERIQYMK